MNKITALTNITKPVQVTDKKYKKEYDTLNKLTNNGFFTTRTYDYKKYYFLTNKALLFINKWIEVLDLYYTKKNGSLRYRNG